jgi:A/G-specific adenine glycosylase
MKIDREAFSQALLNWYQPELRQMPWRESQDPYQIWISEIMLQQTQVNTVKPYFRRFVASFPNVAKLAQAPLDQVLKHWEGLGYYSRARNLHKGAQVVCIEFGGNLPSTPSEIIKIPGIGPYTAGAILSIAFQRPEPAIDGNVLRVFSRLFASDAPIDKKPAQKQIELWIRSLIDPLRPGDFNQSLMELGATICTPTKPQCFHCPIHNFCLAKSAGNPEKFPCKANKVKVKQLDLQIALVQWQQHYLLKQERNSGIFRDLWVLPWSSESSQKLATELKGELGIEIQAGEVMGVVEHTLTHRQMRLHLRPCGNRDQMMPPDLPEGWIWYDPKQKSDFAIPIAHQKVFKFLDAHPLLALFNA